ncbi:MAG: aminopeptidase P family protein [Peptostreptococcaceae bacterium]|nr:aminopeptidase P family protein [Peptostreptococcaceae bacterium]
MHIKERLTQLRRSMKEKQIDLYIIPSADFHQSEYVGDHFKAREYMSGFTGSAGTLAVTADKAGLWTDGRYFLQAENELKDSGIELFRDGLPQTQKLIDFVSENISEGGKLGFDGRVISALGGKDYAKKIAKKNATIEASFDLVDDIWTDRPSLSVNKAFLLADAGETVADKLARVREKMKEHEADIHILSTLDDIAWLYNVRGDDVAYSPVVLSYTVITHEEVFLFVDESKFNEEILASLAKNKVQLRPYNAIYEFVKTLEGKILVDENRMNYLLINNLSDKAEKVVAENPTLLMKAIKNPTELDNIHNAHVKDGVAVTRFMYWLKNNIGKTELTELIAEAKMEEFRREQEGFFQPSFHTISAFGANAAMMHYSASETSNAVIKEGELYLIDSGGQYLDGTTDITRTYAIGKVSDELKHDFTLVLKGMIGLSIAKFLYGCRGSNLDILARLPLWKQGIDYQCGTGHGIGYVLNVHESPNGFRWRTVPGKFDAAVLEEGMITTNEPGIYEDGSHGIRLENELVTRKAEENKYGQFMEFEVITYAPIDLDAILPEMMSNEEKEYLNWYHALVYDRVAPHLPDEEKEWLKKYTRSI